ncbi:MAG: proline--tRNA ligase [Candidatus Latescibacterota bacterium]|nr:proline--tRNA ligase [Candidatus Latescibacterota bacterium]
MRMSQLFSSTLREVSSDAEVASHQLLLRAGYIRQLASGIFSYLPLAHRAIRKLEDLIRDEINSIGGQEITMPVVHPAEIWQRTGRYYEIGNEMSRFKDKNERDMVLAMTHEEVVAELVSREINSYRQLPKLVYQIQTKWRDDPRPRSGLIRVREFTMKDSYSLDATWEGLENQYRAHYQSYFNVFNRCGINVIAVASDTGMMGGKVAHEYMYLTPIGEDTLLLCDACGYAANRQVATFQRPDQESEELLSLEEVETPGTETIAELTDLLQVPFSRTAKSVFLMATIGDGDDSRDVFVIAVIRGDMEVNETKLSNAIQAREIWPANRKEIEEMGIVPGYGSPVGVVGAKVIVDHSIVESSNLIIGANKPDLHLKNVNYDRDFSAEVVTDIAAAAEGFGCPVCAESMRASRGVEVGNIFQLGTKYTQALGSEFLDAAGKSQPVIMGSYGIGVGRLLACIAEENHDESGLIWPISVAPFQVVIVSLARKEGECQQVAEKIYNELKENGIEVLFDDRQENPGVKFKDADLIGMPIRLTVGERGLKNGVIELKLRQDIEHRDVAIGKTVDCVLESINDLEEELCQRVVEIPYSQ